MGISFEMSYYFLIIGCQSGLKLSLSQPRTKANSCLFCGEILKSPSKCQYCGFRFCEEHLQTDNHHCGKTRYAEYVRKKNPNSVPNLSSGSFVVVCDTCGYRSPKDDLIEFAGEELVQHMQTVGCSNTFLEEVDQFTKLKAQVIDVKSDEPDLVKPVLEESKESVVDQLSKLAALKESGVLSNEEFLYIKKEIIKKLK